MILSLIFSDKAHVLRQELGKVKAAHMKLMREVQEREAQLAKSEADRTRVLNEQKSHAKAHYIQETRLQATIAQQSKLIDYLQKVGTISPRSGGFDRIKKVRVLLFSLTRCMVSLVSRPSCAWRRAW